MKILVVVGKAVLGGHVISAFTVARHLKKRGHTVLFAGGRSKLSEVIEKELPFLDLEIPLFHGGLDYDHGGREAYFTWKSFGIIPKLRKIIRDHNIDILHAFDARAYVHSCIAALLEKKPITCTLCGGVDPYYNIPAARKIIVFSEEQRNKMLRQYKWKYNRVEVIRTRVDIEKIMQKRSPLPVELTLDPDIPAIMMISSFDGTKEDSIRHVVHSLELLLNKEVKFQIVFIGGRGAFFEGMKELGDRINTRCRKKVFWFTGPVIDAYKLLQHASIVLGVGRSAFEGMAYGKPTIVVGANGFAGVVSEKNIEDIAYYNFSGRNQGSTNMPDQLASAITTLLSDANYQKKVGQFGRKFVFEEIDVRTGISRIESVYQVNMQGNTFFFRLYQWLTVFKIMLPIWRDNWWHTFGIPLKRILGRKVECRKGNLQN